MFKKVLIANRGEIAVRIIRACRELNVRTVAVFSEADRQALHVRMADEAYLIGPPPARDSYLHQERIIAVAHQSGAAAIHPGYGFLAENGEFADAVTNAGLTFIGPSGDAMRKMGDKVAARRLMRQAGLPVVPGSVDPVSNDKHALRLAEEMGYPVLIKAAAGGGGKGMRLVHNATELPALLRTASSEAQSSFGDGRVYLEKYLEQPRHVEFQIFADRFGNCVHLGERECSIQRRHQKVIEESPSVLIDEGMRAEMGKAAVAAAKSCSYLNAGTVEFIVDKHRKFYFLEMNTRLQVEHPVTEMVTGIDMVKLQLEIAAGNKLPMRQDQIRQHGHAIECRIYAEDVENNFAPSIGRINHLQTPDGIGIREDSGVCQGQEIVMYYDPMISKLIAWGRTRGEAIQRTKRALQEYEIGGVHTTVPFCLWVMAHPLFQAGEFDTHFVANEFRGRESLLAMVDNDRRRQLEEAAALAAVLHHERNSHKRTPPKPAMPPTTNLWKLRGWRSDPE